MQRVQAGMQVAATGREGQQGCAQQVEYIRTYYRWCDQTGASNSISAKGGRCPTKRDMQRGDKPKWRSMARLTSMRWCQVVAWAKERERTVLADNQGVVPSPWAGANARNNAKQTKATAWMMMDHSLSHG